MEKILNSIEELYKLITGTLPEGHVERIPRVNMDMLSCNGYYGNKHIANCYFSIDYRVYRDNVKIEYGKVYGPVVINGRIYKYV